MHKCTLHLPLYKAKQSTVVNTLIIYINCANHRYLRKVDCSRYISKKIHFKEQVLVIGTKPQTSMEVGMIDGMYRLPCLSGQYCKWLLQNAPGRGSASSGHINLRNLLFFRYLCTKQSRRARKADGPTRQSGWENNVFTLTANIFAAATNNTDGSSISGFSWDGSP